MTTMPLRILVITSRPLLDETGAPIVLLDVEEERRRIREATKSLVDGDAGSVELHLLPHATTGDIKNALSNSWDVVHFTGHGSPDGSLILEDAFGVAHFLSAVDAVKLFNHNLPPLVVLSACHSEAVADALLAAGLPALISVDARVPIADRAAILFAEQCYNRLAKGWSIETAFKDAQNAVSIDAEVGDAKPPLDKTNKPETPWSTRFKCKGKLDTPITRSGLPSETINRQQKTGKEIPRTSNLPTRNSNFVGRAKEIVSIVKAFDERMGKRQSPRVAIHGAGGMGKTELSIAVGWWYLERELVDAVLWASASLNESAYKLRDLASLLSVAQSAFHLPYSEQSKFEKQKQALREFLSGRNSLLLLDNWETVVKEQRKEIWEFILSLPDTVRVLVNTREALPAKNTRNIELETLTPEDGATLFLNIARNAGYFDRNPNLSDEETAYLSAIVEKLGGYPLAIEVVAGQTASRSLQEIWDDLLRFPKNALEGKDELTGDPRGVWTSLGFSYDVLPEPEQALFRKMAVFLAPARTEDIAAVTQTPNAQPLISELVKRALVRMNEGAYALLPVVQVYAESKFVEGGENLFKIHYDAVLYYDEKNTIEGKLTASEHLFELVRRTGDDELAKFFVEYLGGFYQELVLRGYWAEARRKAEQAILVARIVGDKKTEAQFIGELGNRYYEIGEYERARQLHDSAGNILKELGDKQGVSVFLHQLAMLAHSQGNYPEAERLYHESLNLAKELGDKGGIARSMHQLAILAQDQGNYPEAERLYHESLNLAKELGDKRGIADSVHQLAMLAQDQGDYPEAEKLYKESLDIKKELGNKSGIASSLHQLAMLAQDQGDYPEAERLYKESLKTLKELGDKRGIAYSMHQLANINYFQNRYTEAEGIYKENLNSLKELGDKSGIANSLHQLAMLAQDQGNYPEAERLYNESLNIAKELGDKNGIASTYGQLGKLAFAQGNYKEAFAYSLNAFVIFEGLHSPKLDIVKSDIASVREAVGEEQFNAWVEEITSARR